MTPLVNYITNIILQPFRFHLLLETKNPIYIKAYRIFILNLVIISF